MNSCQFTGRITKDPEIKYTAKGNPYVRFTLAVNRTQKDEKGNYITDWIPMIAWMQRADFISKFITKGNMLSIVGQMQSVQYQDQSGQNKVTFEVLVDQVENMTPRQQEAQPQQPRQQQQPQQNQYQGYGNQNPQYGQQQPPSNFGVPTNDDLPF